MFYCFISYFEYRYLFTIIKFLKNNLEYIIISVSLPIQNVAIHNKDYSVV